MSTFAVNKKARFDYDLLKSFEAGVVLFGYEAKAVRKGKAKLEGSYVVVRGGETYWVGASIAPYQPVNTPADYDPERPRTLLLNKKEIAEIERATEEERLTCVAVKLFGQNGKIKLEIAIARGKKKADKRESIKARDTKRDIDRVLKTQR